MREPGYETWSCNACQLSGEGGGDVLDAHMATKRHIRVVHKLLVEDAAEALGELREFEEEHGLSEAYVGE